VTFDEMLSMTGEELLDWLRTCREVFK